MKLISLAHAVVAHNVIPAYLKRLIKSEKIIGSITPEGTLIDEESLKEYLAEHPVPPSKKKFNLSLSDEQVEAIDADLFNNKDAFTILNLLKPCRDVFNANIRRMAQLIENDKYRDIFYSVSTGTPFKEAGQKYGLNPKTVASIYQKTAEQLMHREEDTFKLAKEESERCAMLHHSFLHAISELHNLWTNGESFDMPCKLSDIEAPAEIANYLNSPLSTLDLCIPMSVLYLLRRNNIVTLSDLLRYTKQHGWKRLLKLNGVGGISYSMLLKALMKERIIDEDMNCSLYQYIYLTE